jgi:hypothetical protein
MKIFQDDEHGYLAWLEQHPRGFVINTTRKFAYCRLHRAMCRDISTYTLKGPRQPGGFTENQYIKICSVKSRSLERWHKQTKVPGSLLVCKKCKPYSTANNIIWLSDLQKLQDASLARFKKDTPEDREARDARLAKAPKKPKWVTVRIRIPVRNQDVRAAALDSAKGKCQGCGKNAPFKRQDKSPYLEVHHIKPLASGGNDTVKNAKALCPNCHRKAHYWKGQNKPL